MLTPETQAPPLTCAGFSLSPQKLLIRAASVNRTEMRYDTEVANRWGLCGRNTMDWFSRKTSIAGMQLSNWILVVAAVVVIWIIYKFIAH